MGKVADLTVLDEDPAEPGRPVAGIGVARLWDAEALVEVQGVAVIPD